MGYGGGGGGGGGGSGGSGGGAGGGYYTVGGGRAFSDSDRQENAPLNITPGAIRFNTDSMKLEYFRISTEGGDTSSSDGRGTVAAGEWVQLTTDSPDIRTGGTRGLFMGGSNEPSPNQTFDIIDFVQIDTTANAVDFGDLAAAEQEAGALGGHVRGYYFGGDPADNQIETIVFASTGNATDYGDLSANSKTGCGTGNRTRGIAFMASDPLAQNRIDCFALTSTGTGVDFGNNDINGVALSAACGSPTRGICGGGSGATNAIGFITISTLGNATDFGDLTDQLGGLSAGSNAVRGLFAGGFAPSDGSNLIDYITIATLGNAVNFGDLTRRNHYGAAATSSTRFVYAGGDDHPSGGNYSNIIDYVEFESFGNAVDFGDLTQGRRHLDGCSNGNGGVG